MESKARRISWNILSRIESSGHLTPVLEKGLGEPGLSRRDRAFITELVYGVLRQRGHLDWVINQKIDRTPTRISSRIRNLLRIGAYQILFLTKVPPFAAVNEAVRDARSVGGAPVAGFVNAVLRQIARSPSLDLPDPNQDPVHYVAVAYSHPEWLVNRWIRRYGLESAIRMCRANNAAAPLTVRVNTLKTTREALARSLAAEAVRAEPCSVSADGLRLILGESAAAIPALESFNRGEFYVQDEAAQLISAVMDPQPGELILDACAAPGGKTTHMAERMKNRGRIVAVDYRLSRLKQLAENTERLGISIVSPVVLDASAWPGRGGTGRFDRILVDAPCSGLGLLRRNPEGRWHKAEDLIFQYHTRQSRILTAVAPLLKPGGVLVYSTCTTEPEENEWVINAFGKAHPDFHVEDIGRFLPERGAGFVTESGALSTVNNSCQMDSFFAVRMGKNP